MEVLYYSALNAEMRSKYAGIMFDFYPGLPRVPTTLHHACYYRLKNMGYDWTLMDLVHQEIELIFVLCSYRYYVTSIFLVCVCTVL